MADEKPEKPALSRNQLKRLAAREKMGKELLAEIERLEREGVRFLIDYKDGDPDAWPSAVLKLLLAPPPVLSGPDVIDGQVAPDEDGAAPDQDEEKPPPFTVASQRDKALELIRRDPDFMLIRDQDLSLEEREDGVYLPSYNRLVLEHWASAAGVELNGSNRVYWPEEHRPAKLPEPLLATFREQRPSWLLLLRHENKGVVEFASKRLADPLHPDEVVLSLLNKRLQPLLNEYQRTLKSERIRAAEQAKAQAEADHEAAVEDAWSSFFLEPLAKAPRSTHPRGVAESLGDIDR